MPAVSTTYDAIIIGAGISGLVCASYLAKSGMKVLVVEQHDKPGGYCTSFKRHGFTFDAAAHVLGDCRKGGNFRRILAELGIDKLVKISRVDPSDTIITPRFKLTFMNDVKETIDNLVNIFPQERDNIVKYYAYYNKMASTNPFETVKLKDQTFYSFLRSYFTDENLINTISYPVFGYGGLPPSLMQAFTGVKIFNEFLIDGGYYPDGCIQNLPNAFEHIIKENRGTILYRRLVEKILCKNNSAVGVKLKNGESYISKYVVSACDISQTFKTFLAENLSDNNQITAKLNNMTPSISTFILYIGIDKPFDGLTKPGTNIWYLPYYDLDKMYGSITQRDYINFGDGYVFRLSPDNRTILAFCVTSFKTNLFWKQNKKKIAEEFLDEIEKHIPSLKKHIVYYDAATPYTLYRYTLNYNGANYGWAPLQSQLFDPDFRLKSFIKGLYLTGHWTTRAHGIPGVAYLGYDTAKLILKSERMNPIVS